MPHRGATVIVQAWRCSIVGVALLTVAGGADAADLIIKERHTFEGMATGTTTTEATQYSAGNKRVTDSADSRVIVDLDARTFTVANKKTKTYWSRSLDELKQRAADSRKRIEAMPEQTRKMVEGMMGGTEVSLKPTGKSETIAGYTAKEYKLESPRVTGSLWVTEALQDPVGAKAAQAFSDAVGGSAGPGGALAAAMGKVNGMPLRTAITMTVGPQKVTTRNEVLAVQVQSPPPEALTVPEGFAKQDAPSLAPQPPKLVPQVPAPR